MSDRRRTGDGEYIAQHPWALLTDVVAMWITQRVHFLVEAMQTQIRVCPSTMARRIRSTVRRRADEPVLEPRTSRREAAGPRSACLIFVVCLHNESSVFCIDKTLAEMIPETAGDPDSGSMACN